MKILINSKIKAPFNQIANGFNKDLFRFLLPPKKVASLIRYEGEKPGSIIHIRFNLPWRSDWISRITEKNKDQNEYYFIDTGVILPFGLKRWMHRHIVKRINTEESMIVDEINFSTGNKVFDFLIYPILYLVFYPRKRSYKKYFEKRTLSRLWQQSNQNRGIKTY